jgi:hypothetical protein
MVNDFAEVIFPVFHGKRGLQAIRQWCRGDDLPENHGKNARFASMNAMNHGKKVCFEAMNAMIHGKNELRRVPIVTVTITQYQLLADEILRDLNAVAEKIARLQKGIHELPDDTIRAYVNVPVAFLATAVSVVEQEPTLQNMDILDPQAGHDTLQFLGAFRPVLDDVTAFGKSLKRLLMLRKAALALNALRIYAVIRGLARTDLRMAQHASNLQRDLGPRGAKKKRKEPIPGAE